MRHELSLDSAASLSRVLAVPGERTGARFAAVVREAVSALSSSSNFPCSVETLPILGAFNDLAAAGRAVDAVCRAPVVVFDCDGFEPGVLLLIGIRGALRRGISICAAELSRSMFPVFVPYNLQCVSFADFSAAPDPAALLALTISLSLWEYEVDATYRDLPGYNAVRRSSGPAVQRDGVLVLCPYAQPYTDVCWSGMLREALASVVRKPHRLADCISARLAADTFHTRLRENANCIADWTNVRPDLFYELGVRIAVSEHACLHIIADGRDWNPGLTTPNVNTIFGRWPCPPEHSEMTARNLALAHLRDLISLFQPVPYRIQGDDTGKLATALKFLHFRADRAATEGWLS